MTVRILPFRPDRAPAFDAINRAWIADMFVVEPVDDAVLSDPQTHIIDQGGDILFAATGDDPSTIVGAGALKPVKDGWLELTKMGVIAGVQGKGVGAILLKALIARGLEMGADPLFLLTNSACKPAIHLYETHGFEHDEAVGARFGQTYSRCDVSMRYRGTSPS